MSILNIWKPRIYHLASLGDENSIVFKWLVVIDFRAFKKRVQIEIIISCFIVQTKVCNISVQVWFQNAGARKAIPFVILFFFDNFKWWSFIITTMKFNKCFFECPHNLKMVDFLRVIFLTRGGWDVGWFYKESRNVQSLHIQKTKGMKAPMATNIGNMAEDSSSAYGSTARGPLGFRFLPDWESVIWSLIVSSSVSLGSGGSVGQSIKG